MPSRGVSAPTAAHKTIVSPYRITHDPSACLATRPISTVRSRSPTLIDSFKYFLTVILVRLLLTIPAGSAGTQRLIRCDYLERDWSATVPGCICALSAESKRGRLRSSHPPL